MKFKRQDYFRYKKLGDKWRRPRGRQSKMRKCKAGAGKMPKIGYRTKKDERGKIKINGKFLNPVLVTNTKILEKIGKNDVVILSSTLGLKKIKDIEKKAKEKGIIIMNKKRLKALLKRNKELKKKKEKEISAHKEKSKSSISTTKKKKEQENKKKTNEKVRENVKKNEKNANEQNKNKIPQPDKMKVNKSNGEEK